MDIYTFTYSHITKGETIKEEVLGGGVKKRRSYRKTFFDFGDLCSWVINNRDRFERFHIEGAIRERIGFEDLHMTRRPEERDRDTDMSILRIR